MTTIYCDTEFDELELINSNFLSGMGQPIKKNFGLKREGKGVEMARYRGMKIILPFFDHRQGDHVGHGCL